MDVKVIMPNGETSLESIKSFDTAKDLLNRLIPSSVPADEKKRYRMCEVKIFGTVPIERQLESATNLTLLKKDWDTDRTIKYFLKLVMVNHEIIVNFNIYFRMTAGKSEVRATFYVSEETTIAQLESEVKTYLNLPREEKRFGLMGNYDSQELRKLSNDEKVLKLKTAWENPSFTFFQYQVLPEAENQLRLGADKEGFLEFKNGTKNLASYSRKFISLRGTTLFAFKDKGEHEPQDEINQVTNYKIVEIGEDKKKGLFSSKNVWKFELGPYSFGADDESSMKSWVQAIKSCGSRHVAKDTSLAVNSQTKRTLIPISEDAAEMARKLQENNKIVEEKKEEASLDDVLESIKAKGKALIEIRGREALEKTKELVLTIQGFSAKCTQKVPSTASEGKKANVQANADQVKDKIKEVVAAAKLVVMQQSASEVTVEVQKLSTVIHELTSSCEFLILAVRTDDDIVEVAKKPEMYAPLVPVNAELNSAISGLSMFGVAPELMAMMQQAAAMPDEEEEEVAPAKHENIQAVEDPALDDILSNLQDSLSGLGGLDDYDFAPQPVAGGNKFSNNNSSSSNNNNSTAGGDSDFGFDTSATCVSCYGSIEGTVIKAFEKTYHPHCFYCSQCGKSFTGNDLDQKQVVETSNGLLCKNDWLSSLPKCPICVKPVEPSAAIFTGGVSYHQACFQCTSCKTVVPPPGNFDEKNALHCDICFHKRLGTLCEICQKPIFGNSLVIAEKKRHLECLICHYCKKQLTKDTAKIRKDNVYCAKHAQELF